MTDLEELDDKIYADRTKVLKSLAKGADMAMQELEDKLSRNLRITAALEAADKATPGPWELFEDIFLTQPDIQDRNGRSVATVRLPYPMNEVTRSSNATLIAAAPDLAAEVVRLRKWQSKAVDYLDYARGYFLEKVTIWEGRDREKMYQTDLDEVDRLIAEAQGE